MLLAVVEDLIAAESDLVVVGRSASGQDPLIGARGGSADILLAHDGGAASGSTTCLDAILAEPPLSVLAIGRDGDAAVAVSLARQPVSFKGNGAAPLAAAIRAAYRVGVQASVAVTSTTDPSSSQER